MSNYRWLTPVMVMAAMMVWVAAVQGAEKENSEKKAIYEEMIDRYAASCENQSQFRHSRSEHLRQKAEISCLKAAYVRNYKNKIISDLIKNDISPKTYKVRYFVNALFYDLIRRTTAPQNIPSGYVAAEKVGVK